MRRGAGLSLRSRAGLVHFCFSLCSGKPPTAEARNLLVARTQQGTLRAALTYVNHARRNLRRWQMRCAAAATSSALGAGWNPVAVWSPLTRLRPAAAHIAKPDE